MTSLSALPQQKNKNEVLKDKGVEKEAGEGTQSDDKEEFSWDNTDNFYEESALEGDWDDETGNEPLSKGLVIDPSENTPSQRLRQPVKFLLDDSTSLFRDAILREGYEAKRVDVPGSSQVTVLQLAHVQGTALLTLDKSYLSIARGNNKHGILILPESFEPINQDQEQKVSWLRELLRCHDEVNKIRFFPIRAYTAKREGTEWRVEEAREGTHEEAVVSSHE